MRRSGVLGELARELRPRAAGDRGRQRPAVVLHTGTVTAVDAGAARVSVRIGADTTATPGLRHLAGYVPAVNDRVVLLKAGPALTVVLDRLA